MIDAKPEPAAASTPVTSFQSRALARVRELANPTILGLDPDLELMPPAWLEALRRELAAEHDLDSPEGQATLTYETLWRYNAALLEATADVIGLIKPQLAYYERYGEPGLRALRSTIARAKALGFLVIADGKRNDIGKTSRAYAEAWIGGGEEAVWDCDALTVNAYLGSDGIAPFTELCARDGRGIFVLVRTSNPSATELQDLELADGRLVYEAVADQVADWGRALTDETGYSPVGAVVGATWPGQAAKLRERMPEALILVPGYGAQGATADDCMASFDAQGEGALVNASRSLMYAWRKADEPLDFAAATRREAIAMRDALREAIERRG